MVVFYGIQKLSLLDYPGKLCCTLFTGGCNMRCPFCHNAALVTGLSHQAPLDYDSIKSFLIKRTGVLEGVAITGGEPLMYDLTEFITFAKNLGYKIKLDTNGSFPDRLERLLCEGLVDYVAIDIKNSPEKYAKTVGVPDFDLTPVLRSVELLKSSTIDYEFRTTVVKELHDRTSITECAEMISGAKAYYLQKFVDSHALISGPFSAYSDEEMLELANSAAVFVPNTSVRGI